MFFCSFILFLLLLPRPRSPFFLSFSFFSSHSKLTIFPIPTTPVSPRTFCRRKRERERGDAGIAGFVLVNSSAGEVKENFILYIIIFFVLLTIAPNNFLPEFLSIFFFSFSSLSASGPGPEKNQNYSCNSSQLMGSWKSFSWEELDICKL